MVRPAALSPGALFCKMRGEKTAYVLLVPCLESSPLSLLWSVPCVTDGFVPVLWLYSMIQPLFTR